MNRNEILEAIKSLASSQGFYSRLYDTLSNKSEQAEEYLMHLENKKFADVVDLILYLEE